MLKFHIMNESDFGYKLQLTSEKSREGVVGKCLVYHRTSRGLLEKVLAEGLKPNPKYRNGIDAMIDQFAPSGFSRKNSVFAYPDLDNRLHDFVTLSASHPWIYIQVEVDPTLVFVANKHLYTLIKFAKVMKDIAEAERLGRTYWESGMLLGDYLKLNPTDPRRFTSPEALIPGGTTIGGYSYLEEDNFNPTGTRTL